MTEIPKFGPREAVDVVEQIARERTTDKVAAEFLRFEERPQERGMRTFRWDVRAINGGYHLGLIKWYSPWRRYVFEPVHGCVFDAGCLTHITKFITDQMEKRRRRDW